MPVSALGYVGARAKDLGDWASYGAGPARPAARRQDRARRWRSAWTTASSASSSMPTAARASTCSAGRSRMPPRSMRWRRGSKAAGVKVARGSRALADERHGEGSDRRSTIRSATGWRFSTAPRSRPIRSCRAARCRASAPGRSGSATSCSTSRASRSIDKVMPFYRDLLGFRLTDYYSHPFEARFLHVNPRHHSLAFIKTGKNAVHHIMMEVFSLRRHGAGLRHRARRRAVATTLGRHTCDFITSFYRFTPSGFMVEYGWGARSIDPDTWQAFERKEGPSMWGHDRTWLSPEEQAEARALRMKNAAKRAAPAGAGDGRQLSTHGGRLSVVGQRDARRRKTRLTVYSGGLAQTLGRLRTRSSTLMRASAAAKRLLRLRQRGHDDLAEQRGADERARRSCLRRCRRRAGCRRR